MNLTETNYPIVYGFLWFSPLTRRGLKLGPQPSVFLAGARAPAGKPQTTLKLVALCSSSCLAFSASRPLISRRCSSTCARGHGRKNRRVFRGFCCFPWHWWRSVHAYDPMHRFSSLIILKLRGPSRNGETASGSAAVSPVSSTRETLPRLRLPDERDASCRFKSDARTQDRGAGSRPVRRMDASACRLWQHLANRARSGRAPATVARGDVRTCSPWDAARFTASALASRRVCSCRQYIVRHGGDH